MGEPRGILSEESQPYSAHERADKRGIKIDRDKFYSYDSGKWDYTFFDNNTGGYVVTELDRFVEVVPDRNGAPISPSERDYQNEKEAAVWFAKRGFQIEHLANPGLHGGNPDANVLRDGANFRVNGIKADIKTLDTPKRFTRNVNRARGRNGAEIALVHIKTRRTEKYENALKRIIDNHFNDDRLHGYYYFEGDEKQTAF